MRPNEDLVAAQKRKLRFYVSTKDAPGARWVRRLDVDDLERALRQAGVERAYEVAVFANTASGGLMYWTSRLPGTFNSTVLAFEVAP